MFLAPRKFRVHSLVFENLSVLYPIICLLRVAARAPGTLSHGLRRELFDYVVHGRRPTDKRAGLACAVTLRINTFLRFKKASLM